MRERPSKAAPCWYFQEHFFTPPGRVPPLSPLPDEYFFVVRHDEYTLHGHLGRLDRLELFFTDKQRGITYFDDYQAGKKGYFAFDQAAVWRLESVLPVSPLVFVLKKINLTTMEDYKPGHTISVTGTGNVVAAGTGNQINIGQMNVQGNLGHLKAQLAQAKVPAEDIEEIAVIVQQEKPAKDGELPPKTQSWLNKMVGKAATGGWEIMAHTAGHLLALFIKSYYGLPG
jgi:hypothetical protein